MFRDREVRDFDFPCSPTFRAYYAEQYGVAGVDYMPYQPPEPVKSQGPVKPEDVNAVELAKVQLHRDAEHGRELANLRGELLYMRHQFEESQKARHRSRY